jgi:hypothetical protein
MDWSQCLSDLDRIDDGDYLKVMRARTKTQQLTKLVQVWPLSTAATLGSAVRAKGILLEVRARLPFPARKLLTVEASYIVMRVPEDSDAALTPIIATVTKALIGIDELPVIPREAEDILSIKSAERHRWLKDGRLQSAGTRTVKLRGRARKITFHVFDPRHIEDLLDRDMVSIWREDDAVASAENRRRAAGKAALTRAAGKRGKAEASRAGSVAEDEAPPLANWEEFDRDGLLR